MDRRMIARELVGAARELVAAEEIAGELKKLVITQSPPKYSKAAVAVRQSRRYKNGDDSARRLYVALVELADLQATMERRHEEMRDAWSDLGTQEARLRKMTGKERRIKILNRILDDGSAEKIDGTLIDLVTANMLKTVHDALKPANQKTFDKIPLRKLVDFGWSMVK